MGIALLGGYAVLLLLAAFIGKRSGAAAFFVNNRASSAQGVGFSIIVSCVGASATIGVIGMAFIVGTPAIWWLGAGALGLCLLSLLLAERVRESAAYTMPQMVETFLGARARPLISVVISVAWMAILAAQYSALSAVLQPMTGFSGTACLLAATVLVVAHTLGGQAAVMRIDRLQALILLGVLAILLAQLTGYNPGWPAAVRLEAVNEAFGPGRLVYYLVVVGANYLVCPMLFGRLLSAKDAQSARRGGLIGAAGLAGAALLIVCVGLACRGLVPEGTPADAVLSSALSGVLPFWMQLLVSLALISAIVSSADSCLITAATVFSHDILKRRSTSAGRWCVAVMGIAGALLSLSGKGIIGFLMMGYDVYACGVVAPVFIGLLLQKRRRIDPRFACAAVLAGGALGAVSAFSGQELFSYAGLAVSSAIALAGAGRRRHGAGDLPQEQTEAV